MPRALIVHYSRTGHTARLAKALADRLRLGGYEVETEAIRVVSDWNKWVLPIPLLPLLPLLPVYLISGRFRRIWHRIYHQPEQAIQPLAVPDVSDYDLVLIGTPKWLYISYPVARWINVVRGLEGRNVAPFASFCGPPLKVFEIEMLFTPLEMKLREHGARVLDHMAISSNAHLYFFFGEMAALFRFISLSVFKRPLADFTLDGELGRAELQRFCDVVCSRHR